MTFDEIADRIAKENGWEDFNDVLFNAERRTIANIIEEIVMEL